MSGVELDHVSIRFGDFLAVDDCHLTIEKGEFFSFLGPSGCGKTTILRAVSGFQVALHCGLADQRLARAYHGARTQTAKQSGLSKEALRRLRLRAMVAADLEYDNRSLGGHRQWCAGEGRRGVARLLKYLD